MAARGQSVSLRTVCKLGTIAHNRAFSARDFTDYTGKPRGQLSALLRRGIVKRVNGSFYPTSKGWKVIDRACRRG